MLKNILIILGILILLVVIVFGILVYLLKADAHKVARFIKENPDKASILLVQNDTIYAQQNPNRISPLASTVKIIIAIEYAEQAAKGKINPDEQIDLSELDKLYIPNTDGDAHKTWLNAVQDKISKQQISIREIAKGMIKYSSNANTEWLLHKLGMEHVNTRLDSLGLKQHSKLYDIVSALFISNIAFPQTPQKELAQKLKALSIEQYRDYAAQAHTQLMTDTSFKHKLVDLNDEIQKIWSDNLPASTVTDYVSIMKKINSRTYFSEQAQHYLDELMEFILENPKNKQWLAHCGTKGGSTLFVLTKALYATDIKGNKTELAYFFNNLSTWESVQLESSLNEFELKILQDKSFVKKLKEDLYKD